MIDVGHEGQRDVAFREINWLRSDSDASSNRDWDYATTVPAAAAVVRAASGRPGDQPDLEYHSGRPGEPLVPETEPRPASDSVRGVP